MSKCAACGIIESWRYSLTDGYCDHCRREAARGANMAPDTDVPVGRPEKPLTSSGQRVLRYIPKERYD